MQFSLNINVQYFNFYEGQQQQQWSSMMFVCQYLEQRGFSDVRTHYNYGPKSPGIAWQASLNPGS